MSRFVLSRRSFWGIAAGSITAAGFSPLLRADDRPLVVNPRSTSGDKLHEPDWKQRLTITVGTGKADLVGGTDRVLQAAVDYVARLGGGTVQILPGEYRLRNSVFLPSGVRILGSGGDAVVIKNASHATKLVEDSDWYDQEVTFSSGHGFEVGDGVCLRATNPDNGSPEVLKRTLVARDGDRFKLDKALRVNYWLVGKPTATIDVELAFVGAHRHVEGGALARAKALERRGVDAKQRP